MQETTSNEKRDSLKRNVEITEHLEDLKALLTKFDVNQDLGLNTETAKKLLSKYGSNSLTPPAQVPAWIKFLKELTGFFSLLVRLLTNMNNIVQDISLSQVLSID